METEICLTACGGDRTPQLVQPRCVLMLCAPRGGRGFFDANTYVSVVAGRGRGGAGP